MPLQLHISFKKSTTASQHICERDFVLWVIVNCKSSILPTPRSFPCSGTFCMLSLSYQAASIQEKWQCTDRWNSSGQKQWKGLMSFLRMLLLTLLTLQVIHGQPTTNTSLICCGSQDKQWHQEPLSPSLPLPLAKLDLLGSGDVVERVFESVSAVALPEKRIAVATTDNGTNMIKGMRDDGVERWPCAAVCVEQGDKEYNEESEQQQQC